MDLYEKARSCPASRELLVKRVQQGWTVKAAAQAAGMSERRAYHWLKRYREEGKPRIGRSILSAQEGGQQDAQTSAGAHHRTALSPADVS